MTCCDRVWSADRRCGARRERGPFHAGEVVYCKLDHVGGLFDALRRQRNRVVLVTSESDDLVTPDFSRRKPPQVAAWFSTNSIASDVHPLPLGLANSYCTVTLKGPDLVSGGSRREGRLLYVNFRVESNPSVRAPVMNHFCRFRGADWLTIDNVPVSLDDYRDQLMSHRFVLCPPGNGVDTHRMWEALYAGVVPVVQRHPALEAFRDLPILFVESFEEVTEAFLLAGASRLAQREVGSDMLRLGWWRDRIRGALNGCETKVSLGAFLRGRFGVVGS